MKKIIMLLVVALAFCIGGCKKTDTSKTDTPKADSVSQLKKTLSGTLWIYEYTSPNSGIVYSYGLAFLNDKNAEIINNDAFFRAKIKACEYEFKNGEGVLYIDSKKEYEDKLKEMEEMYKMMGMKRTTQELVQEYVDMGGIMKFKYSNDVLIIPVGVSAGYSGSLIPGIDTEYKQITLEEMQKAFKGYRSN